MSLKTLQSKTLRDYMFFISEITVFALVYIFTLYSLWVFFSKDLLFIKVIITLFVLANAYNMSKHFIYVRITIWKAQQKNLKNEDWFKELKK